MKVVSKQRNSRMCYVCGMDNPEGLKAQSYNMEDGSVMTKFRYRTEHQSFPLRVHGGLIATMFDELAFRAYWVKDDTMLGATMSIDVKYRKPVPYEKDIIGKGIIVKDASRYFVAEAQLFDEDGVLLANSSVNYIKLPIEKIADADFHEEMCYLIEDDVTVL